MGRNAGVSWCESYARYRQWVRFFSSFRTSVLTDDQARVATFFQLPFRWNHRGRTTVIRTSSKLARRYREIFKASAVARIRASLTQAPFCRNVSMATIGSGVVWGAIANGKPLIVAVNS